MKARRRKSRPGPICLYLLLFGLAACAETAVTPSALDPQGPGAARIATLWWLLLALGTLTFLVVIVFLILALWRGRAREGTEEDRQRYWLQHSHKLVIGGGVIFPALILFTVYGFTLHTLKVLNAYGRQDALLIEVVGHQWWWEVNYPQQGVTTANEIHIPVGQPVQLELTSADVIHSFWVPELHGKLDLVPGRTNTWWLQADTAGQYWGLCAEFCGTQHAKMLFVVVAEPEAELTAWLANQQRPAAEPTDSLGQRGQALFMETACDDCHVIRGTAAVGDLGPDLTHFASRLTLGAGIASNTRRPLAKWIVDPHDLKPGNLMPGTQLPPEELEAMLAYLQTLE